MTLLVRRAVHSIINNGQAALWMPPSCWDGEFNLDIPDIYTEDSSQKYPLASKLEFADGRMFRYARFGGTLSAASRLAYNGNLCPGATGGSTYGYEGSLDATSNYLATSKILIMNDTTDRAKNYYEDGMLAVYPSGHYCEYRIAGNDAATSVDDVTIYLDTQDGIKTALVVNSTGITAYPSIFYNVQSNPAQSYQSAVGVLLASSGTSTYYGWLQRKGRCIITPTAYFGDSANERLVMSWTAGVTCTAATGDPSSGYQIVGYLTQQTQSGYGDLETQLMLE